MTVNLSKTAATISSCIASLFPFNTLAVLGLVSGLLVSMPTRPQAIDERVADMMTAGWRAQTSHQLVQRSSTSGPAPREIASRPQTDEYSWQEFRRYADQRFDLSSTRAVLIAKQGTLKYERYLVGKASAQSTPIGNSMSKSLVSLAVGKALCMGALSSLDQPVAPLVPGLVGTSWGASTIRDLLRMSSGAFATSTLMPTGWRDEEDTKVNRAVYSRQLSRSYTDLMRRFDTKIHPPGTQFHYNNYDTIALSLALEAATGKPFATLFAQTIWQAIGAESDGAWVTNEKAEVASYFGFSARPQDWLRLGIWVLEERSRDTCFGQYLRDATQQQIVANWPVNKSYGYQIWTQCTKRPDSFCFLGNHGQQLIFDPTNNTVLYAHATSNATNSIWREVFDRIPTR
jgi:CubicO group peptidase (beta-lactamase class C family)